jgi:transposase
MSSLTPILTRDPDVLIRMVHERDLEIERLHTMLKTLSDLVFGARSERAAAILETQGDLDLGDLATDVTPPPANDGDPAGAPGSAVAPSRKTRRKPKRNIGLLPTHLPRVEEIIEPASKACPCCAGKLHKIGQSIAEALDAIPAILRVLRTIRPIYACRACQDAPIQAPARARLMDGGMATTAMVAHVVVSKFAWHTPLYRQTQIFAGQGVHLDRSTLARWACRAAWWLRPLYDLQLQTLHAHPRLFCDETRMPVLEAGRKRCRTAQFWTHAVDDRPWKGPAAPAVVYVFARGRGHKEIKAQLEDFQGILQVDAYGGYSALAKDGRAPGPIRLAFCLAHARRKFTDVYKASRSPIARDVIERLGKVYAVEAEIKGTSAAERLAARKARTAPLMAALKTRLERALEEVSAKSPLAGAIRYSLNHWVGLTLFLDDGRIEVDNNTVERSMRPIALGRKNSLFAGNDGGAETWAILASLLNTAKLNDLDPFSWLNDVLEKIVSGEVKSHQLSQLLAWNWKAARALAATPVAETVAA